MKIMFIRFVALVVSCLAPFLYADSTGTGFFVSDDGYLVTNFHVIEGSSQLFVKHGSELLSPKVVAVDVPNDLALLKVPPAATPFPYLRVDPAAMPTPGSDVFTVGFPDPTVLGVTPKTTRGNVTASAGIKDDPRFFQISVQIQPGNSGGPLIDAFGNVIGVTTLTINAVNRLQEAGYLPQNVNYALKSSYLKSLFDQVTTSALGGEGVNRTERRFDEIQRATQDSVALIVALSQASLPSVEPSNPSTPPSGSATPRPVLRPPSELYKETPTPQPNPANSVPRLKPLRELMPEQEVPPTISGAVGKHIQGLRSAAQPEPVETLVYSGHVGRLEAIFFLKWLPDRNIQGTYFYPERGMSQSYTLVGNNRDEGVIILEEYTDQRLTARVTLSKTMSEKAIIWEGTMKNEDGRSFPMSFSRLR